MHYGCHVCQGYSTRKARRSFKLILSKLHVTPSWPCMADSYSVSDINTAILSVDILILFQGATTEKIERFQIGFVRPCYTYSNRPKFIHVCFRHDTGLSRPELCEIPLSIKHKSFAVLQTASSQLHEHAGHSCVNTHILLTERLIGSLL